VATRTGESGQGAEADGALILRAQDGDSDAFGALVARYMRPAYFSALGLVGSREESGDVIVGQLAMTPVVAKGLVVGSQRHARRRLVGYRADLEARRQQSLRQVPLEVALHLEERAHVAVTLGLDQGDPGHFRLRVESPVVTRGIRRIGE